MEVRWIAELLDREFSVASNEEDLTAFSILDDCRAHVHPAFLEGATGLFTQGADHVRQVITGVFLTDGFLEHVPPDSLVVTHHHFDYYEDDRGFQPISAEHLRALRDRNVSIYVLHAPLDTHPVYGTSKALADCCGVTDTERFFDYYGAPAALIGTIPTQSLDSFSRAVTRALQRPDVVHKHRPNVKRVAVIAGGGDLPEILQYAYDRECDTMLTGTVANRWRVTADSSRDFLRLNDDCKLNLIGGTHYGTERPAMIGLLGLFRQHGIPSRYVEDILLLALRDTQ